MSTDSEKDDTEVFESCDSIDRAEEPRITDSSEGQDAEGKTTIPNCDDYYKLIQSGKKIPLHMQESLTSAFSRLTLSSCPVVNQGKVIEIPADFSVAEAVKILAESNMLAAPVVKADITEWRERYLGVIDYTSIILWVLETAEMAAAALLATSATAPGVGASGLDATGPAAGMGVAAAGAAVVSGNPGDIALGGDLETAANHLVHDFNKLKLKEEEEPFKSTKVSYLAESFMSSPFFVVTTDNAILPVMLLLSKYGLKNVTVAELGQPPVKNFITQSAIVQTLEASRGRDWFDLISSYTVADLGLPYMSSDQVISVQGNDLILEAFKKLGVHGIGGLPVLEGPNKKIVGEISVEDIKYLVLKPEIFSKFRNLTVKDFVETIDTSAQEVGKVVPPVTCKRDSTLGSIIHTLASKKLLRVYIVDDENELVGSYNPQRCHILLHH